MGFFAFFTGWRRTLAGSALACFGAGIAAGAADELRIRDGVYSPGPPSAATQIVENRFYRITIVPSMGGRIVEYFDKASGLDLVYDAGYGGLLDDHGARVEMPYLLEWLKRDKQEAIARLTLDDEVVYQKTVHFYADRSSLQVETHVENHSQTPNRMLFRNVVRPGGGPFTGEEAYFFAHTAGMRRLRGMPRVDDLSDPWCALVLPSAKRVVATAFEGDILRRVYTWEGGKAAPTYEFMFPQVEPGKQVDVRYWWLFAQGLDAVDYAHRNFLARLEGAWTEGGFDARLDLLATWVPMKELSLSAELLDGKRQPIGRTETVRTSLKNLETVVTTPLRVAASSRGGLAILVVKLESPDLPQPVVIEKAFGLEPNAELPAEARRPVRWLGTPVEARAIPGWKEAGKIVARPDETDRKRGWLVFEEKGARAGQHIRDLAFDLVQQEPEGFALRFHPISAAGQVTMAASVPPGMTLETFVPEMVPQNLWGRTVHGWKLLPGTVFTAPAGEDRALFFRLGSGDAPPGKHVAKLTFRPTTGEAEEVAIRVNVRPLRFPRHPGMVFDVNNAVNYLCAKQVGKTQYEWNAERAENYLGDMARHGVDGQTMNGINSPAAHYQYDKVKVRDSGLPLPDAIKKDPTVFRGRAELPPLDFSEWDWFVDRLLEHGMTHVRWPLGSCGEGFQSRHMELTKQIYGRELPSADVRHQAVREWYEGAVVRYLKDRGIPRVFGTIDDEIPSEELAWWVQHAHRAIQMGFEPGVTQSAKTIADTQLINMVAPFMKHWIVGTLNKAKMDQRRAEGVIRPEHWVTTYVSSACHWSGYDELRGSCGLNPAFFDLDACWIQVYYRWNQAEAVIFPTETGPISSASWEGARDGLDDGNLLLLARAMAAALPPAERASWTERLEKIVGMREDSFIRFMDRPVGVGAPVTRMGWKEGRAFRSYDAGRFRAAKTKLLDLVEELAAKAPVQKAAADFGLHPLVRDGKARFRVPEGMAWAERACRFLMKAGGDLKTDTVRSEKVDPKDPWPVFFLGTFTELKRRLPELAGHPDLRDLGDGWPKPGSYVVRFVRKPVERKKGERMVEAPESMVLVCGDDAGAAKAEANLPNVVTPAKGLYSHWFLKHRDNPGMEERK
ncbi:MAG: hypothetical protein IT578_07450 [Verrucomicrobiae bacterium]|nr:hypothetical protein [Verrucomicrobiae bacterium]